MKTLVLGGGVMGVTTASFLARAGHEVTVASLARLRTDMEEKRWPDCER